MLYHVLIQLNFFDFLISLFFNFKFWVILKIYILVNFHFLFILLIFIPFILYPNQFNQYLTQLCYIFNGTATLIKLLLCLFLNCQKILILVKLNYQFIFIKNPYILLMIYIMRHQLIDFLLMGFIYQNFLWWIVLIIHF